MNIVALKFSDDVLDVSIWDTNKRFVSRNRHLLTLSNFNGGWKKYVRVLGISETILEEECRNTKPVPVPLFSSSSLVHDATPTEILQKVTLLQVTR